MLTYSGQTPHSNSAGKLHRPGQVESSFNPKLQSWGKLQCLHGFPCYQKKKNDVCEVWLVVWAPLKNMNVNWDDHRNPILMGKCQKWQPVTTNQEVVVCLKMGFFSPILPLLNCWPWWPRCHGRPMIHHHSPSNTAGPHGQSIGKTLGTWINLLNQW